MVNGRGTSYLFAATLRATLVSGCTGSIRPWNTTSNPCRVHYAVPQSLRIWRTFRVLAGGLTQHGKQQLPVLKQYGMFQKWREIRNKKMKLNYCRISTVARKRLINYSAVANLFSVKTSNYFKPLFQMYLWPEVSTLAWVENWSWDFTGFIF